MGLRRAYDGRVGGQGWGSPQRRPFGFALGCLAPLGVWRLELGSHPEWLDCPIAQPVDALELQPTRPELTPELKHVLLAYDHPEYFKCVLLQVLLQCILSEEQHTAVRIVIARLLCDKSSLLVLVGVQ
jgi:hypothetical protein